MEINLNIYCSCQKEECICNIMVVKYYNCKNYNDIERRNWYCIKKDNLPVDIFYFTDKEPDIVRKPVVYKMIIGNKEKVKRKMKARDENYNITKTRSNTFSVRIRVKKKLYTKSFKTIEEAKKYRDEKFKEFGKKPPKSLT